MGVLKLIEQQRTAVCQCQYEAAGHTDCSADVAVAAADAAAAAFVVCIGLKTSQTVSRCRSHIKALATYLPGQWERRRGVSGYLSAPFWQRE